MSPEVEALLRIAEQSLDAAETLLRHGHCRFSVSRSYYTMFYCVQALHLSQGRSYSKHGAAIAGFGRHFVKAGLLDKQLHQHLRRAFEDRQRGDYEAMEDVSPETSRVAVERSREFLNTAKAFLQGGTSA